MDKDAELLLELSNSLMKSVSEAYRLEHASYYDEAYKDINKVIKEVNKLGYSDSFEITLLNESVAVYGATETDLIDAMAKLRQIISVLEVHIGAKAKTLEFYKNKLEKLNKENEQLKKNEETFLKIIQNTKTASSYPVSEEKLKKFEDKSFILINESLACFSVGAFTACVMVCRVILEGLVQSLCDKNYIKVEGLGKKIEELINSGVIEKEHHSLLLMTSSLFGNKASHNTTEIFDRDKANNVLSAIFILIDEVGYAKI